MKSEYLKDICDWWEATGYYDDTDGRQVSPSTLDYVIQFT